MKPIPYDKFTLISNKPPQQLKAEIISGLNKAAQREYEKSDPISKKFISNLIENNGVDDFYVFTQGEDMLLVDSNDATRMKTTEPRIEISFSRQGADTKIEVKSKLKLPFIIFFAVLAVISAFFIVKSILESDISLLFFALYMIVVPYLMIFGIFLIGNQRIKKLITDIAYNRI